ncbi:MAG: sugar ABC transporter permease, partial [Rhizobiaceae bacterium]|nr:sugar ABC transporter permease [Rhizobiaceae bacterium]
MPHRTFFAFMAPSLLAMLLFIALPIVSVAVQSMFIENEQVLVEVENCGPFGCTKTVQVDEAATALVNEAQPLGRFVGFGTYTDRNHLAFAEVS